jgi:hypothetical protein
MKTRQRYLYALLTLATFGVLVNALAYILVVKNPEEADFHIPSYKVTMKQSDAESVIQVIQAESFDAAFSHYSSYRDISDIRFHDLRKAYIAARNELMDYVNEAAHTKKDVPYYMADYK